MTLEPFKFQFFEASQWKDVTPHLALLENEVHLWRISEVPPKTTGSLAACLPLFKHYLGDAYSINRNENGKPLVYNSDLTLHNIQFNISHTKNVFLVAFVSSALIGVDIEDLESNRPWQSLADRFFALQEAQQIKAVDESQQLDLFFKFWTLKEAMIKCLGISIFTGISRAQFSIGVNRIHLLNPTIDDQSLHFFHFKDRHYFSIALTPRD